jgi:hypothetical protein
VLEECCVCIARFRKYAKILASGELTEDSGKYKSISVKLATGTRNLAI